MSNKLEYEYEAGVYNKSNRKYQYEYEYLSGPTKEVKKLLNKDKDERIRELIIKSLNSENLAKISENLRNKGIDLPSEQKDFKETKDYLRATNPKEFTDILVQSNAFSSKAFNNDYLVNIDQTLKAQREMAKELLKAQQDLEQKARALNFLEQNIKNSIVLAGITPESVKANKNDDNLFEAEKKRYLIEIALKGDDKIKDKAKANSAQTSSMLSNSIQWAKDSIVKETLANLKELLKTLQQLVKILFNKNTGVELTNKEEQDKIKKATTITGAILSENNSDLSVKDRIITTDKFSDRIYLDKKGNKTIGYGFQVDKLTPDELVLNNGVVEPMSREVAEKILETKLKKILRDLESQKPWIKDKPEAVQNSLTNMAYGMGSDKLIGLNNMLKQLEKGEQSKNSINILDTNYQKRNEIGSENRLFNHLEQEQSDSMKLN